MPTTSFQHRAATPASPELVWERLQNPDVWAEVAGADETSEHVFDGGQLRSFRFSAAVGGIRYHGQARVTEARPHRTMTLSVDTNEVKGGIQVAIVPSSDGTMLDVVMTMRPNGIVGTMVFGVVSSAVSNTLADSVERLAASMA